MGETLEKSELHTTGKSQYIGNFSVDKEIRWHLRQLVWAKGCLDSWLNIFPDVSVRCCQKK